MKNFYHLTDSRFKFFRHWDVIRSWDHQKCLTAVECAMEMAQRVLGKGLHTKDSLNQWKVSTCLLDIPEIEWNKRQKKNVLITLPLSFWRSPSQSLPCWAFAIGGMRIGHFGITFGLFFKASNGAYPFIWKLAFICMWIKLNFHMKGWAPGLALKMRPKVVRKWPIYNLASIGSFRIHIDQAWLLLIKTSDIPD